MELVRYRTGEAIRWLETGAERMRKDAQTRGRNLLRSESSSKPFLQSVASAAGTLVDLGRSAYADLLHAQANGSEYVLQEKHFDVVKANSIKTIPYDRVKSIAYQGDKVVLTLDKGTITIRPQAYIVSGRVKIPVGWSRNGLEVPWDLLIDELAARCKVDVDEG
ncbi:MAG: hypothetical protein ACOYON_05645 [Fimbriimonas sp.]